jgi:hypothetical protein
MEGLKNVFQIWRDNGKNLPIMVKRFSWGNTAFLVTEINSIVEHPDGRIYGQAYGYYYQNGKKIHRNDSIYPKLYVNDYLSKLNEAGCYQWILIPKK